MTDQATNDNVLLVVGKASAGKSASLMELENPEGVLYLNTESGKKLPFRSKFTEKTITDPYQVYEAFDYVEQNPGVFHTCVIDSLTYLMDMFESLHVLPSSDTQKAWGAFQQYFKVLMQYYVARSSMNTIFTAHVLDTYNGADMVMETKVPIKGALKNNGIESYFSQVIAAKKVKLKDLSDYDNEMLNVTPEDEALGFKHVFQTRLTKDTVNERLRGPMGLFTIKETFIDNNLQLVLNRLHQYYGD